MALPRTPQQHLAIARGCLLGARDRLAMSRRIGCLNSNDRDLHAQAEDNFLCALDLVWDAQLAAVSA